MRKIVFLGCAFALAACANLTPQTVVADGQLFCATVTAAGPLVVQIVDATASSKAVTVTDKTADTVAAICKIVNGIPVVPPANPAVAPTVAVIPPKA
jgi:hypothetical protein